MYAVATNMWSPQILGLNQTAFFTFTAVGVVAVVTAVLVAAVALRKKNLSNS